MEKQNILTYGIKIYVDTKMETGAEVGSDDYFGSEINYNDILAGGRLFTTCGKEEFNPNKKGVTH
jgi:hypothetical protein